MQGTLSNGLCITKDYCQVEWGDHPWPTCQSWAINFLLYFKRETRPQTPSHSHMYCQRWAMHVQAEPATDLPCLPKHKHHPDDQNNTIVACNGALHVFYQVGSYEYDSPAPCWTGISVASYSKLRFMRLCLHIDLSFLSWQAAEWHASTQKTSPVLAMGVRGYPFVGSNRGCNATMCITEDLAKHA